MCIRDRLVAVIDAVSFLIAAVVIASIRIAETIPDQQSERCLLYTSDAADERSSVDLGGRRIIKKKQVRQVTVSERLTVSSMVNHNLTQSTSETEDKQNQE